MNPLARSREPDRHGHGEWPQPVTIRLAGPADSEALARVAERDSRAVPPGPHLVAIRDAGIVAALSLRTGEVIADPFRPTAELVELLRFRARGARLTEADGDAQPRAREADRPPLAPRLAGGCP